MKANNNQVPFTTAKEQKVERQRQQQVDETRRVEEEARQAEMERIKREAEARQRELQQVRVRERLE